MDFIVQSSSLNSADDVFTLLDGNTIPCIGFGTWKVFDDAQGSDIIQEAIVVGYRHFDAAAFYHSEKSIGTAIKASGLPRTDFFITSKVWKDDLSPRAARASLEHSLSDLQTDYVDLLLIHWPKASSADANWQDKLAETWNAFQDFKREGKVKSIGVANFLPHHFAALSGEKPVIDQIEFHVGYLQAEACAYCRREGILVEGWAALGRAALLNHPKVCELASKNGVTTAQLCLRFCLQEGVLPLVKSAHGARMRANRELFNFSLSNEDMATLRALPQIAWSGEHPDTAIPLDPAKQ